MNKKILIIEDDTNLQNIYKNALTLAGFWVFGATSGDQGLQLVKTEHPNCILLDIMLPTDHLNGFDVLEALKQNSQYKNIPVIVITNLDTEKKTALNIGAADYLIKADTSVDELIQKVKQQLEIT